MKLHEKIFVVLVLVLSGLIGWTIGAKAQETAVDNQVYIPVANVGTPFEDVIPEVITGQLVNLYTLEPMRNFPMRLAEVWCNELGECVYLVDIAFSPGTHTDENGYFTFVFKRNHNVVRYRLMFGYLDVFFQYYELHYEAYKIVDNEVLELGVLYTQLEENPWANTNYIPKGDKVDVK